MGAVVDGTHRASASVRPSARPFLQCFSYTRNADQGIWWQVPKEFGLVRGVMHTTCVHGYPAHVFFCHLPLKSWFGKKGCQPLTSASTTAFFRARRDPRSPGLVCPPPLGADMLFRQELIASLDPPASAISTQITLIVLLSSLFNSCSEVLELRRQRDGPKQKESMQGHPDDTGIERSLPKEK